MEAAIRRGEEGGGTPLLLPLVIRPLTTRTFSRRSGGGGGITHVMAGVRMIIDPCIPATPERSTSGFHRPGRHCLLAPTATRREMLGVSHER